MATGSDRTARSEAALTIIAPGAKLEGELSTTGVVKVEGTIVGTVRADRQVLVARGGTVEGDVHSAEAIIGGRVEGGVSATERIEVQGGAVIHGDVNTKSLVVQEGGEINGLVRMIDPEVPEPPSS
ncbi:MAG: polymer-forming cytoskeletal protein [Gemmatimonadota bacterium]|nr:polymer-forming cytoskeletal protein [Gemmatimonadota bacterium]MDH4350864.1 polymer-forming cytoskeletal protein [Gemmatimonadota bacterium]MDH5196921.1 polymer-forming cytoskeletal protein [Gemmatimonadota bacterium]